MSADERELRDVVDAAWVLGAVTRCLLADDRGVAGVAAIDAAAQDVLDAAGVRISPGRERVILGRGLRSQLGQILMVADASTAPTWGTSTTPHWCRKADPLEGCGQSSPHPMARCPRGSWTGSAHRTRCSSTLVLEWPGFAWLCAGLSHICVVSD